MWSRSTERLVKNAYRYPVGETLIGWKKRGATRTVSKRRWKAFYKDVETWETLALDRPAWRSKVNKSTVLRLAPVLPRPPVLPHPYLKTFVTPSPDPIACEQALLFGKAKRASWERASEGPRKGELVTISINFHFHPGNPGTPQSVKIVTANVQQIRKETTACQVSLDK